MNEYQVRVASKINEAQDIASFELVSMDGQALPAFTAGAHIDVHIGQGVVRQYSLCNAPVERHRYVIGVLRDMQSRGGSQAMHDVIEVGSVLQISAPKNHFALTRAKRSMLFAGGIGVTPMLAMAESLASDSAEFVMHYCARSPERMAFRERMSQSAFADGIHYYFDNGQAHQKINIPALLAQPDADTHIYVCGPGGFIDYVVETAKTLGWPAEHVHVEYFGAAPVDASGDTAFDVKIASTGQIITIPVGQTVVHALAEKGIDIPMSCEQGVCGTCLTRVVEGIPDHRDLYLTDEERDVNDQFTPCCSRAKSAMLVLDV